MAKLINAYIDYFEGKVYKRHFARKALHDKGNYKKNWRLCRIYFYLILQPYYFFKFLQGKKKHRKNTIVSLVSPKIKGWILEGICREINSYWPTDAEIHYFDKNLLPADVYFIPHYGQVKNQLLSIPWLLNAKLFVWYTHPRDIGLDNDELVFWLNKASHILVSNSKFNKYLMDLGVEKGKLKTIIGGANPEIFTGHVRQKDGYVGFCSAYYERKNPELIMEIVSAMPERKFLMVGKGWKEFEGFGTLLKFDNFEYVEAKSYSDYPALYKKMSVFVSTSTLEGGPISLLEAMMENVVPVVSNTGFASDIIRDNENGYIFDVNSDASEVVKKINLAFSNISDIRSTVIQYTWLNFVKQIYQLT